MVMPTTPAPWPPLHPFAASRSTTVREGLPDFPGSAGDRELGKFRPSAEPRLTTVAVVNDDGTPIAVADIPSNVEEVLLLRGIFAVLCLIAGLTPTDVLAGAAETPVG